MLKLNQRLKVAFTAACEEVELLSEEFPEFDPTTDTLYKVWLSACKMLNWLQAKKSRVARKVKPEREQEHL